MGIVVYDRKGIFTYINIKKNTKPNCSSTTSHRLLLKLGMLVLLLTVSCMCPLGKWLFAYPLNVLPEWDRHRLHFSPEGDFNTPEDSLQVNFTSPETIKAITGLVLVGVQCRQPQALISVLRI